MSLRSLLKNTKGLSTRKLPVRSPKSRFSLNTQRQMAKLMAPFNKRAFGRATGYQNQVNSLSGALGPTSGAFWKDTLSTTGPAYTLGAQPLYYAPAQGVYVTSADVPAAQGSVNFSNFGFGRRRRSRRRSRRSRRRSRRSRRRRSRRYRKHR